MKLQSVLDLRDEMIDTFYRDTLKIDDVAMARLQVASLPESPAERMAVGARYLGQGQFALAIRLDRRQGKAARAAARFIDAHFGGDDEVDLSVLDVSIPNRKQMVEAAQDGGGGDHAGATRVRPLRLGHSISHEDGTAGTLGMFAEHTEYGIVAISNAHVLAPVKDAQAGDHIYQPGVADGRRRAANRVGRLGDFEVLGRTGANRMDAAFLYGPRDTELCAMNCDGFEGNRIPSGFGSPDEGAPLKAPIPTDDLTDILDAMRAEGRVAKIGRTTGYTTEPLLNLTIGLRDVTVGVPGTGKCRFDDVIEVESPLDGPHFSAKGDSGSVLYVERELVPFGLLFANGTTEKRDRRSGEIKGTKFVTYACHLHDVFSSYQLEPLTH